MSKFRKKPVKHTGWVFKRIEVGNSTYDVANDDHCWVVKVPHSNQKVWLSKSIISWLYENLDEITQKETK